MAATAFQTQYRQEFIAGFEEKQSLLRSGHWRRRHRDLGVGFATASRLTKSCLINSLPKTTI